MRFGTPLFALSLVLVAPRSFAADPAPLPPLPPPSSQPNEAPVVTPAPARPPVVQVRPEPEQYAYEERPAPVHAPKYALWTGARVGAIGFMNSFFVNAVGSYETTGGFVKPGLSTELNLGARLAYRFIPYVYFEHSFLGTGRHFERAGVTASSNFYGLGFRYLAGDVHTVSFASDLALGFRSVTISDNTSSYTMSTFEYFRLGLGAEIRLSNSLTLSPMATISTGTMTDADGAIAYSDGGSPTYQNGTTINNQASYLVLGIGVGAHFDLFGSSPPY